MANGNRTGRTFAPRVSQQDFSAVACFLQLTDTLGFRSPKLYRRFESRSLRQTV